MLDLYKEINAKYGRYFGAEFSDPSTFKKEYIGEDYSQIFVANVWDEFGVTLIEVCDNNMWNEIVVIHGNYDIKDFE